MPQTMGTFPNIIQIKEASSNFQLLSLFSPCPSGCALFTITFLTDLHILIRDYIAIKMKNQCPTFSMEIVRDAD